jgi:hypothetical protein
MRKEVLAGILAAIITLSGCVALGWRFGPGFSFNDKALFSAPPIIVHRGEEYFLTWIQGSHPFFFQPDYKVINDSLVFALITTSSSGNLAGRKREIKIEGAENVKALLDGGAYWWERGPESDGTLIRLKIVEHPSQRYHPSQLRIVNL